jgi:hypothetical protein
MDPVRVETTIEFDGELHLTGLPFRRGDKVEVVLRVVNAAAAIEAREAERAAAIAALLESGAKSTFRSTGPYPSRDELHERS